MNRSATLLLLLAVGVALALRLPLLDARPMHNDEGVNGVKFGTLWEKGRFRYDPNEHHGPSLFYATYALSGLTAAPDITHYSEKRLRLVTVLFGVGLLLLLPLLSDGLGRRATLWAGLFTAVSPAMVFYSRYYIHEMLLVFFTLLAMAAGWRYWRTRRPGWAVLAGVGVGLMDATKETFVITLVAVAIGLAVNQAWNRWLDASGLPVKVPRLKPLHVALGFAAWLLVAWILFSSFFTNASGLADSLKTYGPWIERANGDTPHVHPWTFYFHRLLWFHEGRGPVWTELLIVFLALVGGGVGFGRKCGSDANASFIRFLFLYSLALMMGYTLISYKTPWCALSFWNGFILLAGVGAAWLSGRAKQRAVRWTVSGLIALGAAHLAWESWELSVPLAADRRNPYTYSQTSPDILKLVDRVKELVAFSGQGDNLLVKVMAPEGDYWPLPWYLRSFKKIGWWENVPGDPYAPIMIVSQQFGANLDERKTHIMPGIFELRADAFFELYVQTNLWVPFVMRK